MLGQRVLEFGYPRADDGRNLVYGMGVPLAVGIKQGSGAYIGSLWGQYYFAALGVALAAGVEDHACPDRAAEPALRAGRKRGPAAALPGGSARFRPTRPCSALRGGGVLPAARALHLSDPAPSRGALLRARRAAARRRRLAARPPLLVGERGACPAGAPARGRSPPSRCCRGWRCCSSSTSSILLRSASASGSPPRRGCWRRVRAATPGSAGGAPCRCWPRSLRPCCSACRSRATSRWSRSRAVWPRAGISARWAISATSATASSSCFATSCSGLWSPSGSTG